MIGCNGSVLTGPVCVFLRPAPLLKNALLSESKARELYLQVVENMRKMFQDARLVHADLSEFNILYVSTHLSPVTAP